MSLSFLLGSILGAELGYRQIGRFIRGVHFNEQVNGQIDWKDEENLRFCKETDIEKRFLPFKSAVNMRDIGGYINQNGQKIPWHRIYRGEELTHLSDEDKIKFSELGITHIFDLRDSQKARKDPDFIPKGAKYTNVPVLEGLKPECFDFSVPNVVDKFMRNIYYRLAFQRGNMFAEVLEILVNEPDAVIYVHCTNGKDRTGFMIAIIMLLLGIDKEQVISEYSLSNYHVDRAFELFDTKWIREFGKKSKGIWYGTIGVNPDWLNMQLRILDQYYSNIDDYLLTNSRLRKYDLMTLRDEFLE